MARGELPENDRATLALLNKGIEDASDPDVEEAWAIEAERRWREIESGEVETIPWEEVRAKFFRVMGQFQPTLSHQNH